MSTAAAAARATAGAAARVVLLRRAAATTTTTTTTARATRATATATATAAAAARASFTTTTATTMSSSSAALPTSPATLHQSSLPPIINEPMYAYEPGSEERAKLQAAVQKLLQSPPVEVPIVIGGREIRSGRKFEQVMPTDHKHVLATSWEADEATIREAIVEAAKAKRAWENMPWESRAAIFLRAADLLSTKYRYECMAATMLGQGKNAWQAEIDTAAETADFWRFGSAFAEQIYSTQPADHSAGIWNRTEYRPLEGFIYAISPFNFAAIGANLSGAPALVGNTVIWKPSNTAVLSNFLLYSVLREAGLPAGVINFVPADGPTMSNVLLNHPDFAGLHFTGSTATFQHLWRQIGERITQYRSYPRIVGETGGKNFHMVHKSADRLNVLYQTIRGAFEYNGQKCSATSRMYVPRSMWEGESSASSALPAIASVLSSSTPQTAHAVPSLRDALVRETQKIIDTQIGHPHEPSSFITAVIDQPAFNRIKTALDRVKREDPKVAKIIVGGQCDDSKGFFVQPTVIVTTDPNYFTMTTELFGPVLTVYVYEDADYERTLELCDRTGTYALTGALFAHDRYALDAGFNALRNCAGNFYVNDKSTGAVVGQQAFGGARGSGTNDKAGSLFNLLRWVSPRSIKETFVGIRDYKYPSNLPN